jgi:hypothetical protein
MSRWNRALSTVQFLHGTSLDSNMMTVSPDLCRFDRYRDSARTNLPILAIHNVSRYRVEI